MNNTLRTCDTFEFQHEMPTCQETMNTSRKRKERRCSPPFRFIWIGTVLLQCSVVSWLWCNRETLSEDDPSRILVTTTSGHLTERVAIRGPNQLIEVKKSVAIAHNENEKGRRMDKDTRGVGNYLGDPHLSKMNSMIDRIQKQKEITPRQGRNLQQRRNVYIPYPNPIKIPFPVFVASLFKSGTTTIHAYFGCGGQRSVHWVGADGERTGQCLRENISSGRRPLAGCGDYDVWTDNSLIRPPICWDPSVTDLEAIYEAYPNATLLLTTRDPKMWVHSVHHWGKLHSKLNRCDFLWPGQPSTRPLGLDDLRAFYVWHIEHVRNFAAQHPSMTYIEVGLEANETASILEDIIGIPASCWGHYNRNWKNIATSR